MQVRQGGAAEKAAERIRQAQAALEARDSGRTEQEHSGGVPCAPESPATHDSGIDPRLAWDDPSQPWMVREQQNEARRLAREREAEQQRLRQVRERTRAMGLRAPQKPEADAAPLSTLLVSRTSLAHATGYADPPKLLRDMASELDSELAARAPTLAEVEGHEYEPPRASEMRGVEREQREASRRAEELRRAEKRWTKWWTEIAEMDRQSRPPLIDPSTWSMCRAVIYQPAACNAALRFIGHCYGGAVLHRVTLAAFGGDCWAAYYDETDLCARRRVAACLFMLRQAQLLDYDRDKFGRLLYQPCVWGVGRGALCALLAAPYSERPYSVEALQQSQPERGWFGLLHHLERAGVIVRHRPPPEAACVRKDEIGPTGWNTNRYWVASAVNARPSLRAPSAAVQRLHGVREFSEDHDAGWATLDEGVFAVPRGRLLNAFAGLLLMLRYGVGKSPPPN